MSKNIELEEIARPSNRVTVPVAHWVRWPSLKSVFRPVAEKKAATVAVTPPTGETTKEH